MYGPPSLYSSSLRPKVPQMRNANLNPADRNLRQNMQSPFERSAPLNGREILMKIDRPSKTQNVLSDQSNSQRMSISKYFKESKTSTTSPFELVHSTSKRLREKYDNFCSQPINIPEKIPFPRFVSKQENEQRAEYARQLTASAESDEPPTKIRKRFQSMNVADERANTLIKKFDSKMIHLIGYVENAMTWSELLKNTEVHVVYNVIGKFINVIQGTHDFEKHVFVRGNHGCVLECCYYDVESSLPKLIKGQTVACLGHVMGAQKFTLYTLYPLEETTNLDIQRAIFLSQRMVFEYSGHKTCD